MGYSIALRSRSAVVGFSVLVALTCCLPTAAHAIGILLTGESNDQGKLLVRTDMSAAQGFFANLCTGERGDKECVPAVQYMFKNAPPPGSDGILTVVAAGDVGHVVGSENRDANDHVSVYSGALELITATLYTSTGSTCPSGEVKGLNNGVICGPNFHSVSDPDGLLAATFGNGGAANGTDFTTAMLPLDQRGDSITITQADLAKLIVNGNITIFLFPDPGQQGTSGVADVKYLSAELTYGVAPEPSTLTLTLTLIGFGLVAVVYRQLRRRQVESTR